MKQQDWRVGARSAWVAACLVVCALMGCATSPRSGAVSAAPKDVDPASKSESATPAGKDDLRQFGAWKETGFAGRGRVWMENDVLYLGMGNDMTGANWAGPMVRMNYEITLEAMRVEGDDFFCGLTFPYGDTCCSLILGGWGGTVVGLSCLDYNDAYNNETCKMVQFKNKQWYRIRLRVTPERIEAWIDDEKLVDAPTKGRKINVRWECEPSQPLGISTWRTTGAIRNFSQNLQ